jgi:hypothetical protein
MKGVVSHSDITRREGIFKLNIEGSYEKVGTGRRLMNERPISMHTRTICCTNKHAQSKAVTDTDSPTPTHLPGISPRMALLMHGCQRIITITLCSAIQPKCLRHRLCRYHLYSILFRQIRNSSFEISFWESRCLVAQVYHTSNHIIVLFWFVLCSIPVSYFESRRHTRVKG